MIYISKEGITDFIEIGPGKVLTGMVKRTIKGSNCFSINSITDMKNIMINLNNKKVLITGATGGIGNALVRTFNDFKASVVATGTNENKLEKIKKNHPNVYKLRNLILKITVRLKIYKKKLANS